MGGVQTGQNDANDLIRAPKNGAAQHRADTGILNWTIGKAEIAPDLINRTQTSLLNDFTQKGRSQIVDGKRVDTVLRHWDQFVVLVNQQQDAKCRAIGCHHGSEEGAVDLSPVSTAMARVGGGIGFDAVEGES